MHQGVEWIRIRHIVRGLGLRGCLGISVWGLSFGVGEDANNRFSSELTDFDLSLGFGVEGSEFRLLDLEWIRIGHV